MHVRTYLREIREARGLQLVDAAKLTGISKGDLSRIERGRVLPTEEQLGMLAALYLEPHQDVLEAAYPATVRNALIEDRFCRCGEPLEPSASGARRLCEACR